MYTYKASVKFARATGMSPFYPIGNSGFEIMFAWKIYHHSAHFYMVHGYDYKRFLHFNLG